jgi:hypothetical protein
MTTREKLHQLVEELSEPDVDEALQYITWQQDNGFAHMLSQGSEIPAVVSEPLEPDEHVVFLDELKHGPACS